MSVLLSANSVEKYFAGQAVLTNVSLELRRGDRAALIGPNGVGKSTLLQILYRDLEPDKGSVELAKSTNVGYLQQRPQSSVAKKTVWEIARAALSSVLELVRECESISQKIAASTNPDEQSRLGEHWDRLHATLVSRNAFNLDYIIESVLFGLGFRQEDFDQPVAQLSGGQFNRLMLAALLLEEPDVMLLDEPSNHLDIAATQWLEEFLLKTQQAYLLVSHDRYFLDRVTNRTLELVAGTIQEYPGSYSKYKRLKAERLKVEIRSYQRQRDQIEKIEDFIRRNHYGQKAAQAEDRRKKLERIELVEPPRTIEAPAIHFHPPDRCGDIVLRAERIAKSFDKPLFSNLNWQVERGERWGILGHNGCGKSTLIKCLIGEESLSNGIVRWGTGVRIGYFDQQLAGVCGNQTAADAIRPDRKEMFDQQRRDLLAAFGIVGDLALKKVDQLSGGERSRVALARLAAADPNVMVMDEPTNHLDLWARESLETALLEFTGTLIIVSHDRYFLNQICNHLIVFEPRGECSFFDGNYDHYQARRALRESEAKPVRTGSRSSSKSVSSSSTLPKRRRFPYRKAAEIEAEIEARENEVQRLHADLADPKILRVGSLVVQAQAQLAEHRTALDRLYEHWEEAIELNH